MCAAIGIPTTRVSDMFVRQRLLTQVNSDQLSLFKVQQQIATGRRIQIASEDPQASLRIVSYQQLLARMSQLQVNVNTNQSYLTATDSAMGTASDLLTSVRADVLGAMGTTASDTQRAAAAQQVLAALRQMVDTGNQQYGGRRLFGGSQTAVVPFETTSSGAVRYLGDEKHLQSFADLDLLFDTNFTGQEVFGALSEEVRSTQDMTPILRPDTRLADLHGGDGVTLGSVMISDGQGHTSTVNLSGSETIGDVAAKIHANSPTTRSLDVEITNTGLKITLDGAPGSLSISESGEGTTAKELGILVSSAGHTVTGSALAPRLLSTTRIDDISLFGTRAGAHVHYSGYDNDLVFEAGAIGTDLNNVNIVIVNDSSVTPGDEKVDWDGTTLSIKILNEQSSAAEVAAAVHKKYQDGEIPIDCWVDPIDARHGGEGAVGPATATLTGGSGQAMDRSSGLQILNGGESHLVNFDSSVTVEDLLNRLNLSAAGVAASINSRGNSIDVRSRIGGDDFAIGENGGTTATELGLRTFTEQTRLDQLNYGAGIYDGQPNGNLTDFTITCAGATTLQIAVDLDGTTNIQDVLDRINNNLGNTGRILARVAPNGNGVELVDLDGPGTITVARDNQSRAANGLGLIDGNDISKSVTTATGQATFQGRDVNPTETQSVFTALVRLQRALETNDQAGIQRGLEMLDAGAEQINFQRAKLGVQQQSLDSVQEREENQQIQVKASLSVDLDTDYAQAVSDFTGRQTAYQASLKAAAAIFQMTLLDYL